MIILEHADAYRIGMLTERLKLLEHRAALIAQEQKIILSKYGVTDQFLVEVITDPGAHPIGLVLDAKTRTPLQIPKKDIEASGVSKDPEGRLPAETLGDSKL